MTSISSAAWPQFCRSSSLSNPTQSQPRAGDDGDAAGEIERGVFHESFLSSFRDAPQGQTRNPEVIATRFRVRAGARPGMTGLNQAPPAFPDCASLHPGYEAHSVIARSDSDEAIHSSF